MKNFARSIPDEFKHRDRFRTSLEEMFSGKQDERPDQYEQESAQRIREQQVSGLTIHETSDVILTLSVTAQQAVWPGIRGRCRPCPWLGVVGRLAPV